MGVPIIQTTGSTSGAGTPGVSRKNLVNPETVTLSDTNAANSGATYLWSIVDQPPGSSFTLTGPTTATPTFVTQNTGSIRIKCVVNGIDEAELIVAVPLPVSGGRMPSFLEQLEYNEASNTKGWHTDMIALLRAMDSAIGTVTGTFTATRIPFGSGVGGGLTDSASLTWTAAGGIKAVLLDAGTTNTVVAQTLTHNSSGAGGVGFGVAQAFKLRNAAGTADIDATTIRTKWAAANASDGAGSVAGAERVDLNIAMMQAGTLPAAGQEQIQFKLIQDFPNPYGVLMALGTPQVSLYPWAGIGSVIQGNAVGAIAFGNNGTNGPHIYSNGYWDGNDNRRMVAEPAGRLVINEDTLYYSHAPSDTAGSVITWTTPFYIIANGSAGFGTTPTASIDVLQKDATSGTPRIALFTGGAITGATASAELIDFNIANTRTVQRATGAVATQRAVSIGQPTYSFVGASVITNAASFYIEGAPVAGANATITNSYSIWVANSAKSYFDNTTTTTYRSTNLPASTPKFVLDSRGADYLGTQYTLDFQRSSVSKATVSLYYDGTTAQYALINNTATTRGSVELAVNSVQQLAVYGATDYGHIGTVSFLGGGHGESTGIYRRSYSFGADAVTVAAPATTFIWDYMSIPAATLTYTGANPGAITVNKYINIAAPTITTDATAKTITDAVTLYLAGAPIAAGSATLTRSYALWVDSGLTRLDGNGTHVLELPADATANAASYAGRIPVTIGGVTKYIRYHND